MLGEGNEVDAEALWPWLGDCKLKSGKFAGLAIQLMAVADVRYSLEEIHRKLPKKPAPKSCRVHSAAQSM